MTSGQAHDLIACAIASSAASGDAECLDYNEPLWAALYEESRSYTRTEMANGTWLIEATGVDEDGDEWTVCLSRAPSLEQASADSLRCDHCER